MMRRRPLNRKGPPLAGFSLRIWRPEQPGGSIAPNSETKGHNSAALYLAASEGNGDGGVLV